MALTSMFPNSNSAESLGVSLLGSLEGIGVAEVLQVLSLRKRSGVLTLIGTRGTARILIYDGRVVYTCSETRSRLGYTLVLKSIVSLRELRGVLREQQNSEEHRPIGSLLLEKGLVRREDLEHEIREQILGVVRDLLRWETGIFCFHKSAPPPGALLVHEGLSTEFLLLEISRLRDVEEQGIDGELWP